MAKKGKRQTESGNGSGREQNTSSSRKTFWERKGNLTSPPDLDAEPPIADVGGSATGEVSGQASGTDSSSSQSAGSGSDDSE